MTVFTEFQHPGAFILSEDDDGLLSRDNATLAAGSGILPDGAVLGRVTASGKLTKCAKTSTDGSQTPAAFLIGRTDATSADQPVVILARHAEVNARLITLDPSLSLADVSAGVAASLLVLR